MNNKTIYAIIAVGVIASIFGTLELISYLQWKEMGGIHFDDPHFQEVMKICKKHHSIFSGGTLGGASFEVDGEIITAGSCQWRPMTEEEINRYQED